MCEVGGTLFKQLLGRRLWVWKLVHVPGMGMEWKFTNNSLEWQWKEQTNPLFCASHKMDKCQQKTMCSTLKLKDTSRLTSRLDC